MSQNWNGLRKQRRTAGGDEALGCKFHRGRAVNRRIYTRLAELERSCDAASLAQRSAALADGSVAKKLRETLHACGIEQRETESLAGTFARALGITTQELKVRLEGIAYGQSPHVELTR